MRIFVFVGKLMMPAMNRYPMGRRFLQRTHTQQRQPVLQPARASKRAVRQQPVVTKIDAERAEDK
jgi:hypothetical protein